MRTSLLILALAYSANAGPPMELSSSEGILLKSVQVPLNVGTLVPVKNTGEIEFVPPSYTDILDLVHKIRPFAVQRILGVYQQLVEGMNYWVVYQQKNGKLCTLFFNDRPWMPKRFGDVRNECHSFLGLPNHETEPVVKKIAQRALIPFAYRSPLWQLDTSMGLLPGISGYSTNLVNMSNSPLHPPGGSRSSVNDTNRTPSYNGGRTRSTSQTESNYTVSSAGIVPHSRHSSSVSSSYPNVSRSGDSTGGKRNSSNEEDDEDEEVEIKISPTGSVLAPSPNPYDKTQKLRQANAQLMASRLPPKPPGKVRFNDSVIASEEPGGDHAIRSKKPKTNVTLPPTLKKN